MQNRPPIQPPRGMHSKVPPIILNEWNTGVFDCFNDDSGICLEAMFCWHAQLTAQCNMIRNNKTGPLIGCCIAFTLCDIALAFLPSQICIGASRGMLRKRYEIPCSVPECLTQLIFTNHGCACCLMCQHYRELHLRGDHPGGCLTNEDPKYRRTSAPSLTALDEAQPKPYGSSAYFQDKSEPPNYSQCQPSEANQL